MICLNVIVYGGVMDSVSFFLLSDFRFCVVNFWSMSLLNGFTRNGSHWLLLTHSGYYWNPKLLSYPAFSRYVWYTLSDKAVCNLILCAMSGLLSFDGIPALVTVEHNVNQSPRLVDRVQMAEFSLLSETYWLWHHVTSIILLMSLTFIVGI